MEFDQLTMKEYRKKYKNHHGEFLREMKKTLKSTKDLEIVNVMIGPQPVNMMKLRGKDKDIAGAIERLYANDGRFLDPTIQYPPSMIDHWGKDYALNAQGIYYRDDYSPEWVTSGRSVWIPSTTNVDWEEPSEAPRRLRARVLMKHSINNETWNKSEYAWEADAWSDVFGEMRNDPCLAMDKHDYSTLLPNTDPITSRISGVPVPVKRIPDATFGLTTFSDRDFNSPVWADELRRERLEKLLLHHKCGLLSDPEWGESNLVFPFAVYEAKGWNGDCREARRQACTAAATYLDLLDDLVRRPGPVGSTKPYQIPSSHRFQVFSLTSFGAHWHLLVGYRRPRKAEEHAGTLGMSETVYIFQRVWSGRVTNERTAWELVSLVDQIHLWAITEFRAFIIDHLAPWHAFCDENYLLDWDSVYDSGRQRKRKRSCSETGDIRLPSWTNHLSETNRQKVKLRAVRSLSKAEREQRLRKGKSTSHDEDSIRCLHDECSHHQETGFGSNEAFLDHLRSDHDYPERDLIRLRLCIEQGLTEDEGEGEEEREEEEEEGIDWGQDQGEGGSSSGITPSVIDDSPAKSKRVRVS